MWRPDSDGDEASYPAPEPPEPVGPFDRVEPNGHRLTERAKDLIAIKRLADEIQKSLAEYARTLKYEREKRP